MKRWGLLVLFGILTMPSLQALEKDRFTVHLQKAFNLPLNTPIEIGELSPSPFPGLSQMKVTVGSNQFNVYLNANETHYFWGNTFDLRIDPDKARWEKIDLSNVYSKGSKSAPVTLVEYSDIQCPHCRRGHMDLKTNLYKDFKGKQVRLIYKHYPLSNHDWAEKAALAVECAGAQSEDKFWGLLDTLYENAPEISLENFDNKMAGFIKKEKINQSEFNSCMEKAAYKEKIEKDKKEGFEVGVTATPTIVVNGRVVRGGSYPEVKSLIEYFLNKK